MFHNHLGVGGGGVGIGGVGGGQYGYNFHYNPAMALFHQLFQHDENDDDGDDDDDDDDVNLIYEDDDDDDVHDPENMFYPLFPFMFPGFHTNNNNRNNRSNAIINLDNEEETDGIERPHRTRPTSRPTRTRDSLAEQRRINLERRLGNS